MRFTISAFLELASDGSKHGAAVFVGLVSMGVWVNLVGYGGVFLEPALTDSSFEMTRYAYHAGRVFVFAFVRIRPYAFRAFWTDCKNVPAVAHVLLHVRIRGLVLPNARPVRLFGGNSFVRAGSRVFVDCGVVLHCFGSNGFDAYGYFCRAFEPNYGADGQRGCEFRSGLCCSDSGLLPVPARSPCGSFSGMERTRGRLSK